MKTTRRILTVLFFLGLGLSTSLVNAQSGSRNAGGGGTSSSSGGSGGSGGSGSGAVGNSGNGFGNFSRSLTPQEGALRGQGALVRSVGEANFLSAQAVRERELARSTYIENQVRIERFKREQRQARQQERDQVRQVWAQRRAMREMEKVAMEKMAEWEISWPPALMAESFASHRAEIESLAILYAKLERKEGVAAGLKESIRSLASKIKMDEMEDLLLKQNSQVVRSFVTDLYRTNGQASLIKKMDDMMVKR